MKTSLETVFKSNLLKAILLVAAISVFLLAAYDVLFVFPSFNNLFMETVQSRSQQTAAHLVDVMLSANISAKAPMPGSFKDEVRIMVKDFNLWKVIVFSPEGEIVYSSDPADIGRKLNEKFFFETVAKGNIYSKYIPKNTLTPGGQVAKADVISTYMPLIRNGKFLGAVEVYHNVSSTMDSIRGLFVKAFLVLFLLMLCLFSALVIIWRKANQSETARRKAEEELAESENLLRTIIETVPECIKLVDKNGAVLMMNKAGLLMLDASSFEQIKGGQLGSYVLPEYRKAFDNLKEEVFQGRSGTLEFEVSGLKGSRSWLSTNAVPLLDKDGKTAALLGITRDITQEKRAALALETSLKEKEILLRELYHRTKNNLQVITSLISLQTANLTDERLIQTLEDLSLRIRAMSLVHEKLYKSKDLTNVDVKEYMEDLANAILISYEKRAAAISLDFDIDNFLLNIDAITTLGLIENELMTNSIKYAFPDGRKGRIRISLHSAAGRLEFIFKDNGIGLPDTDLRKVKSLGLKLVKNLATKQLAGNLEINSAEGAEFRIVFNA